MTDIIKKINWKELFFPIVGDIKSLNETTDAIDNNWDLVNNPAEYKEVLSKIQEKNNPEVSQDDSFIILEKK